MRPRLMRKREHGLRINVPCWQARASPLTAKHSVALMMPVSAHRTCLAPSCMRKPSSSPNSRLRKNQRDSQTSGTTGPSAAGRCTHYGGCVAYSDRVGQLHCRAEEGGLLVHRQRESAHPASRYLRFEIGVFSPLSTRQSIKPMDGWRSATSGPARNSTDTSISLTPSRSARFAAKPRTWSATNAPLKPFMRSPASNPHAPPHRVCWIPAANTGALKTVSTTFAMSPSMRTAPASAAAPEPRSWPLYATSPYPFSALLGLATYPQHFAAVPVRVIPLFFA